MNGNNVILLVGENKKNQQLLERFLLDRGYKVFRSDTLEEFDEVIGKYSQHITLIMVDLLDCQSFFWNRYNDVKEKHIPVVFFVPHNRETVINQCRTKGATVIFEKPVRMKELEEYLHSLL